MQHLINLYNDSINNLQQLIYQPASRRTAVAGVGAGFTIVELLIVIVVIGILAAIVIVAFNGIQTQAENTKTVQAVSQYVKALRAYATLKGEYPVLGSVHPCLGKHPGTSCGRRSTGASCLGSGATSSRADFDTEMKLVLNSMPELSSQQMNCGGVMYSGGYYLPSTGPTASIIFFLKGNQSCSGVGGVQSFSKQQQDDTTQCRVYLPNVNV